MKGDADRGDGMEGARMEGRRDGEMEGWEGDGRDGRGKGGMGGMGGMEERAFSKLSSGMLGSPKIDFGRHSASSQIRFPEPPDGRHSRGPRGNS
jgi:hypothetical protein